jgi:hypothetical protein
MVSEVQLRNDVSAMLQGIAIPDAPVARIRAAMGAMPPGHPSDGVRVPGHQPPLQR